MNNLISPNMLAMNQQLHQAPVGYGEGGGNRAPNVMMMITEYQTTDVLDYGCGKGKLAAALPFHVKQYDPAILSCNQRPSSADIVVCTDVMEHIEEDNVRPVLEHIESLADVAVYFVIATRYAKKQLPNGQNAHVTVENAWWWLNEIKVAFAGYHDNSQWLPVKMKVNPGEMELVLERQANPNLPRV